MLARSDRLDLAGLVRLAVLDGDAFGRANAAFESRHLRRVDLGGPVSASAAEARFAALQQAMDGKSWSSTPPPTMH